MRGFGGPHGPGWGRRRGWGQMAAFLRPAILLLLRQDPTHGYTLIEDLHRHDLVDPSLDPAMIYRYLREMEVEGLLNSAWDTSGPGVPRRVYRLTPDGEAFARGCLANLQAAHKRLDFIMALYRRQFGEGESGQSADAP